MGESDDAVREEAFDGGVSVRAAESVRAEAVAAVVAGVLGGVCEWDCGYGEDLPVRRDWGPDDEEASVFGDECEEWECGGWE